MFDAHIPGLESKASAQQHVPLDDAPSRHYCLRHRYSASPTIIGTASGFPTGVACSQHLVGADLAGEEHLRWAMALHVLESVVETLVHSR